MVEQEGHGVREDFAQQSACQMPEVARPHLLYAVALCELAENGVYPVAKAAEEGAPLGVRVSLLGGVWSQKLYAHPRQLLFGLGRVVVAVPDEKAGGALGELGHYGKLVGVGWSYGQASDDARPGYPDVYSKAVEGLPEKRILAEGGFPAEAFTPVVYTCRHERTGTPARASSRR